MENLPFAPVGRVRPSTPQNRSQLTAWTMVTPKSVSTSVDPPMDQIVAVEAQPEKAPITTAYTLRIKPDRRRVQVPIPAGFDRRRPR